jgi:hypothetical protein
MPSNYLKYTQMINFEIGDKCNLTKIHFKCPSNADRPPGKELTDAIIMDMVKKSYEQEFRGFIAWHYYNEPLLQADRIFNLMEQIRNYFPQSRFLLWTNGTISLNDSRVKLFELVYCTDYFDTGAEKLYQNFKGVGWFGYKGAKDSILDERFTDPPLEKNFGRCLRPLVEFIIDNFGVIHFCCYDWSNAIKIGNIWDNSFENILEVREDLSKKVCGEEMSNDAPEFCLRCRFREGNPKTSDFDPVIANEASDKYLEDSR